MPPGRGPGLPGTWPVCKTLVSSSCLLSLMNARMLPAKASRHSDCSAARRGLQATSLGAGSDGFAVDARIRARPAVAGVGAQPAVALVGAVLAEQVVVVGVAEE